MQALQSDIKFIKSILKSWENVDSDMIQFERLAGLSNVIYRVTALDELASPASIIYRKFGENEEIIDRGRENYIFTELAKNGLGPSFYGGDDKSRLEEYYDSRALKPSESSNKLITRGLAKSLASLHQAKMDELSKTPMILQVFQDGKLFKSSKDKAAKDIFTAQEKEWVNEVMSLAGDDEVNFIKEILPKKAESVVFSHNDLHAQNVLLLDQSQRLVLIDYEYSSYNYRGYDIANFFNEATINYSVDEYPFYTLETHKYPSECDLLDFIKYYLFFVKFGSQVTDEQVVLNDEAYIKNFVKEHGDLEAFNTEVEEILGEVRVCAMLSHYYWVLWSVVMSKNPEVGFDYLHYAKGRYDVYQKLKQEYIAAQQGSPKSQ